MRGPPRRREGGERGRDQQNSRGAEKRERIDCLDPVEQAADSADSA